MVGEGETGERPMDLEPSTSVEEVNMEGLNLDTEMKSEEKTESSNGGKKRKPEESQDAQEQNSSNENNNSEEILKKRKRDEPKLSEEMMNLKQARDELDLMCKIWVTELRRLPLDQQLFARKAVCDVLFEARLGHLNKDSVRINFPPVVQNFLSCVHEEYGSGKVCGCPNAWERPRSRNPTFSSQLFPGQSPSNSKSLLKGNLSSPHRPPYFATHSNRFGEPRGLYHPQAPKKDGPLVVKCEGMTARLVIMGQTFNPGENTEPNEASSAALGPPKRFTVNISPYRVENSTNTAAEPRAAAPNTAANPVPSSSSSSVGGTVRPRAPPPTSSNANHQATSSARNRQQPRPTTTTPTVNTSTTPTVNTVCDVRMDTVTTDN